MTTEFNHSAGLEATTAPSVTPEDICKVASDWEASEEQIAALARLIEKRGSMTGNGIDDLTLAVIAYSRACVGRECTGWLPFNVMPGWEDDVLAILDDEDAWLLTL